MDDRTVRWLRVAAAGLVFGTAAFHLWWGLPRSIIYLQVADRWLGTGLPPDPRPFLFVPFAAVLLAGPYLVTRRLVTLRTAYVAGTVLMALSIAAWAGWHLTGHGAFLYGGFETSGGATGHSHDTGPVHLLLDHFVTEPVESAVKTIEGIAIALFVTLLWRDPAVLPDERDDRASGPTEG